MTANEPLNEAPTAPVGLFEQGNRFWGQVASAYELRADELRLLEQACRCLDELDLLDKAMATSEATVAGSRGQDRANPLLGEIRSHRATFAALVKQLALPDDPAEEQAKAASRSGKASRAARARWDRRGA